MSIAKRLNLVMVSAFALLLGCLMFTSLDTAWGLTYQEGDVWIGTDGEQMTPEEAGQWVYTNTYGGISLDDYTGDIIDGEIVGCVPATINDKPVLSMNNVFKDCTSLVTAPTIPDSVRGIANIFNGCTSLVNAPAIPDSVIGMSRAFEGCTSLVNAPKIGNSVESMDKAFYKCTSLKAAPDIPNSVNNLYYTFAYTNLSIAPKIGSSVTSMEGAFLGCKNLLKAPVIPDGVLYISHCFDECISLSGNIFFPDSIISATGLFCGIPSTGNNITVQYTANNTVIPNQIYAENITKDPVDSRPTDDTSTTPGEDEEQDPTTPSNPGETSGNMSIYGTVQPITMIDVTVPLTIQFTIESDRTFTGPDSIKIKSNCPSPLDVNLYGVNKDGSAPSLVAPDTHSDDEWNNLSRAETLASIALMLDNTSLSSTGSTLGRIDSAFQGEKALDLDLSAKYGKAWDNSEDLVFTYNVVFEFAMP